MEETFGRHLQGCVTSTSSTGELVPSVKGRQRRRPVLIIITIITIITASIVIETSYIGIGVIMNMSVTVSHIWHTSAPGWRCQSTWPTHTHGNSPINFPMGSSHHSWFQLEFSESCKKAVTQTGNWSQGENKRLVLCQFIGHKAGQEVSLKAGSFTCWCLTASVILTSHETFSIKAKLTFTFSKAITKYPNRRELRGVGLCLLNHKHLIF